MVNFIDLGRELKILKILISILLGKILGNIDIDKGILRNIDIAKGILGNIDIAKKNLKISITLRGVKKTVFLRSG